MIVHQIGVKNLMGIDEYGGNKFYRMDGMILMRFIG